MSRITQTEPDLADLTPEQIADVRVFRARLMAIDAQLTELSRQKAALLNEADEVFTEYCRKWHGYRGVTMLRAWNRELRA